MAWAIDKMKRCKEDYQSIYTWDGEEYSLTWCTTHNRPVALCEVVKIVNQWLDNERYSPGAANEIHKMLDREGWL